MFSCYRCRASKLRCDRSIPCARCSSAGEHCEYPTSRHRPGHYARRPKASDTKAILAQSAMLDTTTTLLPTGRHEWALPVHAVDDLTTLYFATVHSEMPMLHPGRYMLSLRRPSHMQPPLCLQYALLAAAASQCNHSSHRLHSLAKLALPCYKRAREYIHDDELREDGQEVLTLAHAQCWALLATFEDMQRWYTRAALSVGRAVRLAQLLGLFNTESTGFAPGASLAPPLDWCEREQRRRTVWAIFCLDLAVAQATGWASLMDRTKIRSLLPASEASFDSGDEQGSLTFYQALHGEKSSMSTFACRVIAAHLAYKASEHPSYESDEAEAGTTLAGSTFWSRHQVLDTCVATAFIQLPDHMRFPANSNDPNCVFVNLRLHMANICLCRSAMAKAENDPLRAAYLKGARASVLPSAFAVFDIVTTPRGPATKDQMASFAAFVASLVFLEDYANTHNKMSEDKVEALMALLLSSSRENRNYSMPALRLAQELRKMGLDSSAVDKVRALISKELVPEPADGRAGLKSDDREQCPFTVLATTSRPGLPT